MSQRRNNKWRSLATPDDDGLVMQDGKHKRYSQAFCWLMNVLDWRARCRYGCRWIAPYGFVRNASCPLHD
jgi:hypothetical protein